MTQAQSAINTKLRTALQTVALPLSAADRKRINGILKQQHKA